jgi:hypothetical protein
MSRSFPSSSSSGSNKASYYPIKCILPSEAIFVRTGSTFTNNLVVQSDENDRVVEKSILHYVDELETAISKTCETLADEFHFIYTHHLIFLSSYELLNSCQWTQVDEDNEDGLTCHEMIDFELLKTQLNKGELLEGLLVRRLDAAGHGLFTTNQIKSGVFIGEYVGVISSGTHTSSLTYCMHYPSSDGNGSFSMMLPSMET